MPGPIFLAGDRVDLRTVEEGDLTFLQDAANQPNVWQGTGRPWPRNMTQQREHFEERMSDDNWVHLLVTTGPETPVGTVGFTRINQEADWAELAYWIAPDHQNEGYGTEAAELLVEYGFRHRGFHRIEARVTETNDPSRRLVEKLGFTQEGVRRESQFADGAYRDVLLFGILADEWAGLTDAD